MKSVLILLLAATQAFAAESTKSQSDNIIPEVNQKRLLQILGKADAKKYFKTINYSIEYQLSQGKKKAEIVIDPDKCGKECQKEVLNNLHENNYKTNRVPSSK